MTLCSENIQHAAEKLINIPSNLHHFQWEGVAFLYRSKSALLSDEMGLGKTVQTAIALALIINGQNDIRRALIVAPASLILNWMSELSRWAPSLVIRRVRGGVHNRKAFYLLPIPVLVASYEQIRIDGIDRIPTNTFDLVILDEAQRIKNKDSRTALACRLLSRKRAWALSATPLENSQNDVLSILSFLETNTVRDTDKLQLSEMLRSKMLRRRKIDVRTELPDILVQDIQLELTQHQRVAYDDLWADRFETVDEDRNSHITLLSLITRLKILCNYDEVSGASSKIDALFTICDSAGDSARIIVFSQFVKTLRKISQRLELQHDLLIGAMSETERQVVIDKFKSGATPRVLLISLRAGGVGINLGEATHTVLFDRWWNPAVENQAIYRAHRFERDESLHVLRFLVKDTIEDRIAAVLERKRKLISEVVDSEAANSLSFTRHELMEILELA